MSMLVISGKAKTDIDVVAIHAVVELIERDWSAAAPRTPSNVCRQRTAFPSCQRPETPRLSARLLAEAPLGATR